MNLYISACVYVRMHVKFTQHGCVFLSKQAYPVYTHTHTLAIVAGSVKYVYICTSNHNFASDNSWKILLDLQLYDCMYKDRLMSKIHASILPTIKVTICKSCYIGRATANAISFS